MPDNTLFSSIFTQTLEQAIDAVVVIDANNVVMLFNRAAEQLWDIPREQVIGENVKVLVPDEIKASHDGYVNRNRETGENKIVGSSRDIEIVRKDGSIRWGSFSISKVEVGDQVLYTAFVKDVTAAVAERERTQMLSLVTDRSDNAIFITDNQWNIIYINSGFTQLLGYTEGEVYGKTPISVIAPYFSLEDVNSMRANLASGSAVHSDQRVVTKGGEEFWCSVMANPVFDEAGTLTNIVAILSEITATKLHEILHAQVIHAIASDRSLEVVMDIASRELKAFSKEVLPCIFSLAEDDHLQVLSALDFPPEFKRLSNQLQLCGEYSALKKAVHFNRDVQNTGFLQGLKPLFVSMGIRACWTSPVVGDHGESIGLIAFFKRESTGLTAIEKTLGSILESLCSLAINRENQRQQIRQLAYYDTLTDLPNRSLLFAEAESALREAKSHGQSLAVLYLDVDQFKQFNDSHGHSSGDFLLKELASRLNKLCINGDFCGRLSADEFVIIAKNKSTPELGNFVDEIRQSVAKKIHMPALTVVPSVSVGISVYPDDGHDISTLVHRADVAMNQAKSSAPGHCSYFSHELNQAVMARQKLERALQEAIETNQLNLVYQPQVNIDDGSLYGVEALARWQHPELGFVSPGEFIPLAEESGLIGRLTQWALTTACQQMAQWRANQVAVPVVSINLSPDNFHSRDLCQTILAELSAFNLQPSDILLELTEGVLLDTNPNTMKTLHEIHSHGIGFSLDDFGTGYSSLSYLRQLPIKELKLDKSFVKDLELSKTDQALSHAVIQIGQSLNLKVVAEGVENQAQLAVLREQGYPIAQGYLFARPLAPAELEAWLERSPVNAG
ncbi:EAL domain-containing protein [Reinekea marinisedimentorum]|uniref:cyclic-guanylate-specific phosphodiesterase n=1 Tax=Reinekea marinisedimentorum TaxID=230495 RepID=A0A4V6NY26_9GAMM|nr:EAL domain-containing protein [Reinekea marinisedimentorum]TCS40378.1 PAS domain S-box-containing protein/diguanylate cyclase (GGDEF)-like protein [Reinekea marinisedimentorum]